MTRIYSATYWDIEGQIVGRESGGTVSYTLMPRDGGTLFEREFVYPTRGLLFTLLNWLFVRRRVQRESDEAVRRLKAVLEREEDVRSDGYSPGPDGDRDSPGPDFQQSQRPPARPHSLQYGTADYGQVGKEGR